jgi:hypothetical protein
MKRQQEDPKVADFRPRPADITKSIRHLALDTGNIGWSDHVLEQMEYRDIQDTDVLHVLRTGEIYGDIVSGRSPGEWKCKIVAKIKANRDVGVVTVVCNGQRLFLKTAEWEDLR